MKQIIAPVFLALIFAACQTTKETETSSSAVPTLTQKWQTDTLLTTVESVLYDDKNDVLYAASINGVPDVHDGNGFISKVGLDGKIIDLKWITGLDAPKGMGIANGKLYIADIDRVHEVDIATGKILNSFIAGGAKFLNDLATTADGKVFVSDSGTGEVLAIENGNITKWTTSNTPNPNGLFVEGNNLLIALWDNQTLNSIDMTSKEVVMKADSIENPDGIEAVGDGGYFVSSWNGKVTYVSPDWNTTTVIDTRADSISAADIEYIPSKKLLLVPTFFKNRIVAYEVK